GKTAITAANNASRDHLELAKFIFEAVGRTIVADEKHLDAITGLSASGPAFIYIVIESLAEGGVKVGRPRDVATELAAQTVLGSGAMVLEAGEDPARRKDLVASPAGGPIDGVRDPEGGGRRGTRGASTPGDRPGSTRGPNGNASRSTPGCAGWWRREASAPRPWKRWTRFTRRWPSAGDWRAPIPSGWRRGAPAWRPATPSTA